MQTELQVSLDADSNLHPDTISLPDGGDRDVTSSTANHESPKKPRMLLFTFIYF